ncbi:hypothetical protein ACOTC5_31170 [Achromobacter xylosoxidans]
MSTNSECQIIQTKPDSWFYILEDRHAPQNACDWREHASAYGPFPSEDEACEHLRRNHANPGGHSTQELPPGVLELDVSDDPVLQRLLAEAPRNTRRW